MCEETHVFRSDDLLAPSRSVHASPPHLVMACRRRSPKPIFARSQTHTICTNPFARNHLNATAQANTEMICRLELPGELQQHRGEKAAIAQFYYGAKGLCGIYTNEKIFARNCAAAVKEVDSFTTLWNVWWYTHACASQRDLALLYYHRYNKLKVTTSWSTIAFIWIGRSTQKTARLLVLWPNHLNRLACVVHWRCEWIPVFWIVFDFFLFIFFLTIYAHDLCVSVLCCGFLMWVCRKWMFHTFF